MPRTVKQLTTGCDNNNRERHTTRIRNKADSLQVGPPEDGDPLASLICMGQAVQTVSDCSTLRNVVQFTQRHMLDLNPHVPTTHVHISTYTQFYAKDYYVTGLWVTEFRDHGDGLRLRNCLENCASRLLDTRPTAMLSHSKNSGVVWCWS